ncbi:MAG: hypothetical protein LBJ67_07520 [Planctomycetaceae bacterium]|nr:hypothetical protein [Planctomycetaceae bacterium]
MPLMTGLSASNCVFDVCNVICRCSLIASEAPLYADSTKPISSPLRQPDRLRKEDFSDFVVPL